MSRQPVFPLFVSCVVAAVFSMSSTRADSSLLVIGTFREGPGIGLTTALFDSANGTLMTPTLVAETPVPSFVTIAPDGSHAYVCNETSPGNLSTFAIDPATRTFSQVAQVPSAGDSPCYIELDHSGRYAFAANYSDGAFTVFALDAGGRLATRTARVMTPGRSTNPDRQTASHAHCIVPDPTNHYALAVDLGADRVYIYRFDATTGALAPHEPAFFAARPGSGPRHLRFHPNGRIAYIVNELDCTVSVGTWDSARGVLKESQHISSLPAGYTGSNTSAELVVHPDGRSLYVSNRGLDAIAAFAIDPASGSLTLLEQASSRGGRPRNLVIDPTGRWLLAANQDGDSIAIFAVDATTGRLTPHGDPVPATNPGCLRFVPAR